LVAALADLKFGGFEHWWVAALADLKFGVHDSYPYERSLSKLWLLGSVACFVPGFPSTPLGFRQQ